MKKVTLKKFNLKALNDRYIVEEDPIDYELDNSSGMTPKVLEAIKSGVLAIPDTAEFYAKKYPCTGTVLSRGSKCKESISIGDKVAYARLGVQRMTWENKNIAVISEWNIHGIKCD